MSAILILSILVLNVGTGAGQTIFSHLQLPLGARADGMGEAYSAIAEDATAGWWNAAALSHLESTQYAFSHCSHFQGMTLDYLGLATGFGGNGIGFGILTFSSGELEYREKATQEPLGSFNMIALHPMVSYGRAIDPELSLGFSLIGLYEKAYTDEVAGLALNGGILYYPEFLKDLSVAAVFQNFGLKLGFKEITYPLPFRAKLGMGYHLDLDEFGVILGGDYVWPAFSEYKVHTGIELDYRSLIFVRGGYKWGYDTQRLSFGLGIAHRGIAFDYAYTPYRETGASHKVSLLFSP